LKQSNIQGIDAGGGGPSQWGSPAGDHQYDNAMMSSRPWATPSAHGFFVSSEGPWDNLTALLVSGGKNSNRKKAERNATAAVGDHGLMVEVHHMPEAALSDGAQSLYPRQFDDLCRQVRAIHEVSAAAFVRTEDLASASRA
jgi:hypothetical protein